MKTLAVLLLIALLIALFGCTATGSIKASTNLPNAAAPNAGNTTGNNANDLNSPANASLNSNAVTEPANQNPTYGCDQDAAAELVSFRLKLQHAVNGQNPEAQYPFSAEPACASTQASAISLRVIKDDALCSSACNAPLNPCFLMYPNAAQTDPVCITIPGYTKFRSDCNASTLSAGEDGYSPVDILSNNLAFGNYLIQNISTPGAPVPIICTYYKQ